MAGDEMARFWDERAEENPFYFVDNRLTYGRPDVDWFWSQGAEDLEATLDSLGVKIQPGDAVVEIGCGLGRLTRVLARDASRVVAVDVSERMLAAARQENPDLTNVEWVLGDGASLRGVPEASADVCLSYLVFQHIPDPAITLGYVREMGRVLRPGGWAAFQLSTDPGAHRSPRGLSALKARALAILDRGPRGQWDGAWLGSAVDPDDLRAAADDAGMELERVVGEGTQYTQAVSRRR